MTSGNTRPVTKYLHNTSMDKGNVPSYKGVQKGESKANFSSGVNPGFASTNSATGVAVLTAAGPSSSNPRRRLSLGQEGLR
jgi:hypothetical protein